MEHESATVKMLALIISDRKNEVAAIREVLESAGMRVIDCDNGGEGITQVYRQQPDLVISPVLLPELDGYQICRLLRNDLSTRHIVIVLLSESDSVSGVPWGKDVGADLFLDRGQSAAEIGSACQWLLNARTWAPRAVQTTEEQSVRERRVQWNRRVSFILEEKLYRSTLISRVNAGLCRYDDPVANRRALLGQLSQAIEFDAVVLFVQGDLECMVSLRANLSESSLLAMVKQLRDDMAARSPGVRVLPTKLNTILGADCIVGASAPLATVACEPLLSGDAFVGHIAIGSLRAHAFTVDDRSLLEMFSMQAASALENALLNERSAVLAAGLENLRDAVVIADVSESVLQVNPAACALFGLEADELKGKRVQRLFSKQNSPEKVAALFAAASQGGMDCELIGARGEGTFPMTVRAACARSRAGQVIGTVLILSDLTATHQREAERLQAAEVAALVETAIALNHEINNPLQAILSCAQLLYHHLREQAEPQVVEKLTLIMDQAQRIAEVTHKLEQAKNAVRRPYALGQTMIDIEASARRTVD